MLRAETIQSLDENELDSLASLCVLALEEVNGELFESIDHFLGLLVDKLNKRKRTDEHS